MCIRVPVISHARINYFRNCWRRIICDKFTTRVVEEETMNAGLGVKLFSDSASRTSSRSTKPDDIGTLENNHVMHLQSLTSRVGASLSSSGVSLEGESETNKST